MLKNNYPSEGARTYDDISYVHLPAESDDRTASPDT